MRKTVFVLGAGASKDFGASMPVGEELAATIDRTLLEEFSNGSTASEGLIKNSFRQHGGLTPDHRKAALQIGKSLHSKPSIDELIEEWKEFPELAAVAKRSIAASLLIAESQSALMIPLDDEIGWATAFRPLRNSWASWLFRNVGGEGVQRRQAFQAFSEVAFITFNYDRCLEQFLLANFVHTCGLAEDVARAAMQQVEVHHAYGSLGALAPASTPVSTPFGGADTWSVQSAAAQIKTFTEEVESGAAEKIRHTVAKASRIIFLGFGFHERNLNLLFGDCGNCPAVPVAGTCSILDTRAWRVPASRFEAASRQTWDRRFAAEFMSLRGEEALFD